MKKTALSWLFCWPYVSCWLKPSSLGKKCQHCVVLDNIKIRFALNTHVMVKGGLGFVSSHLNVKPTQPPIK